MTTKKKVFSFEIQMCENMIISIEPTVKHNSQIN
jgi:hypothetical protein